MKDYAAKDFLHPRIALAERVLGIAIIAVIVLGLGWLQQRDEAARLAELNRYSASSLCITGPGEIAWASSGFKVRGVTLTKLIRA